MYRDYPAVRKQKMCASKKLFFSWREEAAILSAEEIFLLYYNAYIL